jgi:arylsulfatase A-like enzyme
MRILYLDLDTLRPDHLACYGYHRNTSPNIDRIAREGIRFENYYCSDAPCLPSRTALVTGMHGIHSGVVNHGGAAADVRLDGHKRFFKDRLYYDSLPGMLRQAGLKTISISPFAERHSSWSFYAGFSEMHNTGKSGMESAEDVTPTALEWIEENAADDNWFLHINYWDAHTPYRAPEGFGNPFKDDPIPDWVTPEILEKHRNGVGPHSAQEIMMYNNKTSPNYPRQVGELKTMDDVRSMFDGYDCGIRYMDGHIGRLLEAFEKKGILDDLVIMVSADHGENLGELNEWGEHGTADQITCRIPMIIRWPGKTRGHVDNGLHYNLDLMPTLAEMLGQKASERWDGQSYAATIEKGEECGRDFLVVGQCAHVCQRGVRFGDWMYIRTYHDGFHLFDTNQLYNIADDPHEQNNLAQKQPEKVREAVYLLNQWHDTMMATSESDVDPLWTVMREGGPCHANGPLAKYCERLKETGREWAIPKLMERHPREFR